MKWERGTTSKHRALALGLVATLGLLTPRSALAQASSSSSPAALGFKLGEGRLHPFIDVDAAYDSLVGFYPQGSTTLVPSGDIVLHARPGVRFDLNTPSTFVMFNGAAEYVFYTGALTPAARALSRFQANVALDARFNADGAVEFDVGDSLRRSDQTGNAAVGVGVVSLYNELRLAVPIHPGGKALEITPRATWGVEFFDPLTLGIVSGCSVTDITCNPTLVGQMNYSNINVGLAGRWKFLPKTAVVLDVNNDFRTYWVTTAANPPATLFRAQAGVAGLISPRVSATLMAGYAGDFAGKKLNTVIGNAEVGYTLNEMIKGAIGYLRNAQPVPSIGVYIDDRGYVRGTVGLWAGRLTFGLTFNVDYLSFFTTTPRNDLLLSGNVNATFAITSWFDVGLAYTIGFRTSTSAQAQVATVNYTRHEVLLHLGFHY